MGMGNEEVLPAEAAEAMIQGLRAAGFRISRTDASFGGGGGRFARFQCIAPTGQVFTVLVEEEF